MKLKSDNLSEYLEPDAPDWIWKSARRILTPWEPDRFKFTFVDPPKFGNGTNPDVFGAILDHLVKPDGFEQEKLVRLLEEFMARCTKQEWHNLYQPILCRETPSLTIGHFNLQCPEQYRIIPFTPQVCIKDFPKSTGNFYQYEMTGVRVFILIFEDHIEMVLDDFTEANIPQHVLDSFKPLQVDEPLYPIVIEGISLGYEVILTDMFPLSKIKVWPGALRRNALTQLYQYILYENDMIVLGEGLPGDEETSLAKIADHFHALSRDTIHSSRMRHVMFKPANDTYTNPAYIVPVRKTGVEMSEPDTKSFNIKRKEPTDE